MKNGLLKNKNPFLVILSALVSCLGFLPRSDRFTFEPTVLFVHCPRYPVVTVQKSASALVPLITFTPTPTHLLRCSNLFSYQSKLYATAHVLYESLVYQDVSYTNR